MAVGDDNSGSGNNKKQRGGELNRDRRRGRWGGRAPGMWKIIIVLLNENL